MVEEYKEKPKGGHSLDSRAQDGGSQPKDRTKKSYDIKVLQFFFLP